MKICVICDLVFFFLSSIGYLYEDAIFTSVRILRGRFLVQIRAFVIQT